MPHTAVDQDTLDRLYPPLEAPEDEALEDLHSDAGDALFQHGLKIAGEIQRQTAAQGRRRRPQQSE